MIKKIAKQLITEQKKTVLQKKDKASQLVSKIFISLGILIATGLVLFFLLNEFISIQKSYSIALRALQRNQIIIRNQIRDLESQTVHAQKFITMGEEEFTDTQKSKAGLSINYATELLKRIGRNHNINNLQINFSSPVLLSGIFEKNSIKINSALITIKFDTITDINVLNFIDEIEKQLPNFTILTDLEMTRTTQISDQYFESLTKGVIIPTLKADVKIRWYAISEK
jgi:hypothetical protein